MSTAAARTAPVAAGIALALALAGCGGGDGDAPDSTLPIGPIDKLFEGMYGERDPEQANQEMIRMEEIVAECMAEQGFDYTPVDYSQGGGGGGLIDYDDGIDEEWGTLEFAKKWGYGATTNPYGEAVEEPTDPGEVWIDPNQAYIESMSESERDAFFRALHGEQYDMEWTEEMETEEYVWDWTTAGCNGRAQHEIYGDSMGVPDNDFADLEAEMQVMWEQMASDPRVTGVVTDWAACMAESGYPGLSEVYDAENLIYERVNALWEDAYADISPDAGEEEWRAIEESIQDELAAITPDEIKTAVADYTCREEVRYLQVQAEVNVEHQERFYALHEDELTAWAESMSRNAG